MMTEAEYKVLDGYVRTIADRLGLRDWAVKVGRHPSGEGTGADMHGVYGRKIAHIRVCAEFRQESEVDQRHYIVHELVHCHFESIRHLIECGLPSAQALSGAAQQVLYQSFYQQLEYGVDAIAVVIASYMPPIVWEVPENG